MTARRRSLCSPIGQGIGLRKIIIAQVEGSRLYGRRLRFKPHIREAVGHAAAGVATFTPLLAQEVRDQRRRVRERDRFDPSGAARYCMNWRSR
jgi:hypothetical protein